VNASVNGSGDLTISGTTSSANYALNGSGDISCSPLKAKIVNANCSGSGDITCHASVSITAKTELSGEITCHGNPSKKNLSGRTKNIHIK
ncbi:GIN domain-containing protein, partial [uncultured Muribaculum sp.]